MTGRFTKILLLFGLAVLLSGCGAPLRYSQATPEAKDFKPKRIAVFPADAVSYPEKADNIEKIVVDVLTGRRWFAGVVTADMVKKLIDTNSGFKQVYTDYTVKLRDVCFSDPELSKQVGEMIPADAFLFVKIDYWNYTVENDDKVGKVGLGMMLVDAATGKVVWKAAHEKISKYEFIKPELANIAKSLVKEMASQMPHGAVK